MLCIIIINLLYQVYNLMYCSYVIYCDWKVFISTIFCTTSTAQFYCIISECVILSSYMCVCNAKTKSDHYIKQIFAVL